MPLLRNGRTAGVVARFQALDDSVDALVRSGPRTGARPGVLRALVGGRPRTPLARDRERCCAAWQGDPGMALRLGASMGVESALTNGPIKLCFRRVRPGARPAPRRAAPLRDAPPDHELVPVRSRGVGVHRGDAAERLTAGAGLLRARGTGRLEPGLREDAPRVRRARRPRSASRSAPSPAASSPRLRPIARPGVTNRHQLRRQRARERCSQERTATSRVSRLAVSDACVGSRACRSEPPPEPLGSIDYERLYEFRFRRVSQGSRDARVA